MELHELHKNFKDLTHKRFSISFDCGETIEIVFKTAHFYHLSGFQYLTNSNTIFKKKEHAYRDCIPFVEKIKDDPSYEDVKERIYYFNRISQTILYGQYVRVEGNGRNTKIKCNYIITLPLIASKYYSNQNNIVDQINLHIRLSDDKKFYIPVSFYTTQSILIKKYPVRENKKVTSIAINFD